MYIHNNKKKEDWMRLLGVVRWSMWVGTEGSRLMPMDR
jgi:hypothetical protein